MSKRTGIETQDFLRERISDEEHVEAVVHRRTRQEGAEWGGELINETTRNPRAVGGTSASQVF